MTLTHGINWQRRISAQEHDDQRAALKIPISQRKKKARNSDHAEIQKAGFKPRYVRILGPGCFMRRPTFSDNLYDEQT